MSEKDILVIGSIAVLALGATAAILYSAVQSKRESQDKAEKQLDQGRRTLSK